MKIKLCLSGGGARGFAHLGVVQALYAESLSLSHISGTSSGGVAGAFLAAGYPPSEILELFIKRKFFSMMSGAFNNGLFKMDKKVVSFYKEFLPLTFEELKLPLYISATDLIKGETIYFHKGPLIEPLIGSCSIPGLFKPMKFNDYLLADGGISNNLPVEPLINKKGSVVGVHVNPISPIASPRSTWGILERTFQLSVFSNIGVRSQQCDFFIEPPALHSYNVYDFKKANEIYQIGLLYGQSILPQLLKKII